jgi:hypothetical protein
MVEKRSAPRNEAFLKGQVRLDGPHSGLDCLVCDISDAGARLQVPTDVAQLPERFLLFIPKTNATHHVRVAWRGNGEVGVSFTS